MDYYNLYRCVIILLPAMINSLGASCGQDGVALVQGDPRLLGAGRPEECLKTFAHRTAGSTIVLHGPILHLLEDAKTNIFIFFNIFTAPTKGNVTG